MIHQTAIIDKSCTLGKNVHVGPYTIITGNVKIGNNTKIHSSCFITGNTDIGSENEIHPFCSIGNKPQDLKYMNEKSFLTIGNNNSFREGCTINPGTKGGGLYTKIGDNSLFMIGVHIAHDCIIGNNTIMANQATLAGHVVVENNAVIGGVSAIHQFCRIGELSMIGGMSAVENDVLPFSLAIGNRAKITGLNLIGLKRAGYKKNLISDLNKTVKELFNSDSVLNHVNNINSSENILIEKVKSFILGKTDRGLCRYEK